FFQAEDGIRDRTVTGVQTCALPISKVTTEQLAIERLKEDHEVIPLQATRLGESERLVNRYAETPLIEAILASAPFREAGLAEERSEERRVGKECRGGWSVVS